MDYIWEQMYIRMSQMQNVERQKMFKKNISLLLDPVLLYIIRLSFNHVLENKIN